MSESDNRDYIRLVNMVFYAYHGAMPEEATLGQKFYLDAELEVDLQEAARTDDLRRTVNYEEVYRTIAEEVHRRRYKLLEALAQAVAEVILERFPDVRSISVRVRKPSVPLGGVLDHVEVEITRRRKR
jgi:dihydroneopterin aldolase